MIYRPPTQTLPLTTPPTVPVGTGGPYGAQPPQDWFAQWTTPSPSSGLPGPGQMPPVTASLLPSASNTGVTGGMPPAQPGVAPTGQTPGSITMQQFNDAWMGSGYPGTVAGLKAFYDAHPEYAAAGITLGGSKGDKVYQNGQYWGDYVIGAGTPGGGTGKSTGSGATGGGTGAPGTLGGLPGAGGVVPGNYLDPYTTPYKMPSLEDLQNSPGYQARLQEGLKGVEGSAAARGTLLTGGTLKALNRYGQNFASNEYNNLFNQNYQVNQGNSGLFYANQTNPYLKLSDLTKIGLPQ